ncbi:Cysteine-rich secretory protein family protein [Sphingomonas guangdongensis]|uniref:Cysteine-rich secretory protein family protein n=1 Tax=Sphingomonas guangdongensis TaxID=1141890 RepID=A0A285QHU9_9SPHN|nr:CAP domain-containing protein [Sphingomonas guangdongensis]SOB81088.1 Cysteine-rich secretory protein family protein [Sphingomonas guangdongensis]
MSLSRLISSRCLKGRLAAALVAPALLGATDLTVNLDARLLAAHNRERTASGLPPLDWNPALAASATRWADRLAATGAFHHYSPDPRDRDPQGENLWAGTRGAFAPEAMVAAWAAEKRHYRPAAIPFASKTGNFDDVGHYTQLMWRRSTAVGCALARGRVEDVLVCRYSEGGNVVGELAF